jgi:hypothetical protein
MKRPYSRSVTTAIARKIPSGEMSSVDELERCHACGGAVEIYAAACPECGTALTEEKLKTFRRLRDDDFLTEVAFEVVEQLLREGNAPFDRGAADATQARGPRKQVTELTIEDLSQVSVGEFALDEEGQPGRDEETLRPRRDLTVVDPTAELFVVSARFTAADGTVFQGYVTPSDEGDDAESPTILTQTRGSVYFAHGIVEPNRTELAGAYAALGKRASELFPIGVETLVPTTSGRLASELHGFTYLDDDLRPRVKR